MPLTPRQAALAPRSPSPPLALAWLPFVLVLVVFGLGACAPHAPPAADFELVDSSEELPADDPLDGLPIGGHEVLLVASTNDGGLALLDERAAPVRPAIPLGGARGLSLAPGRGPAPEVFALARGEDDDAGSELVRVALDAAASPVEWGWFGGDSTLASSPLGPLVASRDLGTRWAIATGPDARGVSVVCPAPAALFPVEASPGEVHAWVGLGQDALGAWVRIDASVDVEAGVVCTTTPLDGERLDDDHPALVAGPGAALTVAHVRGGQVVLDRLDGSTLAPHARPALAAAHVARSLRT